MRGLEDLAATAKLASESELSTSGTASSPWKSRQRSLMTARPQMTCNHMAENA